jgi:hypothetical protein
MAARKKAVRKKAATRNAVAQPRMTAEDRKWRAQDDLRTLAQAEQVRKDPTRMGAARKEAAAQAKALQKATR